MRYTISAATAAAILATISEVEAHCRFVNAYGNYNQNSRSRCLGFRPDIPRSRYGNQIPWQVDVTCFSSPVVPATQDSPYYHTPRKWLSQGCGATLFGIESYYNLGPTNDQNMWQRNTKYYMKPMEAGALTQVKAKTQEQADNGMMVRVTPGGWLNIDIFQVNDDGAGPFRCRIDEAGDGTSFGNYLGGIVYNGANAEKSVYPGRNWETHTLTAPIPQNVKCTAKYGRYSNVCILRCENIAVNGPFGGCIPFQVVYPTPPPPPQPVVVNYGQPEAQPQYGNAGYNVGSGNYIESYGGDYKTSPRTGNKKRDMDAKEERRSRVARSTEGIAKRENEDQGEENFENDEDEDVEKLDKKDVEKRDEENVEKRDHGEQKEDDNEDDEEDDEKNDDDDNEEIEKRASRVVAKRNDEEEEEDDNDNEVEEGEDVEKRNEKPLAKRADEDENDKEDDEEDDEDIEKRNIKVIAKRDHGEHDEEDNEDGDDAEDGEDEDIEKRNILKKRSPVADSGEPDIESPDEE